MYNDLFFEDHLFEKTVYDTSDGETFQNRESAVIHIVAVDTHMRIREALRSASPMTASLFDNKQLSMIVEMMTTASRDILQALTNYTEFMEGA